MKQIYSDYLRVYLLSAIAQLICVALTITGLLLAGVFSNETLKYIGVIAVVLIAIPALWGAVSTFIIAPILLKKQIQALPQGDRELLISEYDNAKQVGNHRYTDNCFIFYSNRLIYIFRYADVTALTKKDTNNLQVHSENRKPVTMPFQSGGANAIAAAYIKSHNPDIRFSTQTSN